ncbi:MFS transporter [Microtetraspora glauca]|uniref:MFS transporter n=1 Tax=Microtetraspora glauca TaxID=1996 RepID=A0ABV3GQ72_MICGL
MRTAQRTVLPVLLAGQAMASLDSNIVTVVLPSIQRAYAADGATVQLIATGYGLTMGVLIVTGARLGDLLGHRRAFLSGVAGFTAASALCGLAPSVAVLVVARVAQAVAGALLIPQVFSLIQLRFAGRARERAVGLYAMVLGLCVAVGQLLGGLVAGADLPGLGWRAVFLINLPVGLVVLAIGRRTLPVAGGDRSVRLDPAGVVLLTVAMLALTVPLMLGRQYGWRPWTWIALLTGAGLLAAFVRHESRTAFPLLDLRLTLRAGIVPGLVNCCLVSAAYAGLIFSLTLHLQGELGVGPLGAGLAFLPYAVGFGGTSLLAHRLPGRHLPAVGTAVFAAAVAVLAAGGGWPGAWSAPVLLVASAGHAAGYTPLVARLARRVGPDGASALTALNSTGPMLAQASAVAVFGGLYLVGGLVWAELAIVATLAVGVRCCLPYPD